MTQEQFIREVDQTSQEQEKLLEFYDLAEKYGFLAPWSEED